MAEYKHEVMIGFEIVTNTPDGEDIAWAQVRKALLECIEDTGVRLAGRRMAVVEGIVRIVLPRAPHKDTHARRKY